VKKDLIIELLKGKKILLEDLAAGQTGPLAQILGLKAELLDELLKGKELLLKKAKPSYGYQEPKGEKKIELVADVIETKINLLKEVLGAPLVPVIEAKKDLLTGLLAAKKDLLEDLARGSVSPLAEILGLKAEFLGELLKGKKDILMKAAPLTYGPTYAPSNGYKPRLPAKENKIDLVKDAIETKINLVKEALGPVFAPAIEVKKDLIVKLLNGKQNLLEELARGQVSPLADILGLQADLLGELLKAKKDILLKKLPSESYGYGYNYKPDVKETKVELTKELLEEKTKLINELFSGKKDLLNPLGLTIPVIPTLPPLVFPTFAPQPALTIPGLTDDLNKLFPVKPEVKVDGEESKIISSAIVSPDFVDAGTACQNRDSIGIPPHAVICAENAHPAIISTTPFAVFVDTRGSVPSRGFHFIYTQQIC
jgi:hypothetical protein